MNKKIINIFIAFAMTFSLGLTSCKDMLIEEPKSKLTPDFLNSTLGLQSGVYSAYSNMRWMFGGDGPDAWSIVGTDEFSSTDQLGSATAYDDYSSIASGNAPGYWSQCLQNINTCNGVIDYGTASTAAGLKASDKKLWLAEAHFLRGFYYYILTMNYGDVPLDLGSGKLKFNLKEDFTKIDK